MKRVGLAWWGLELLGSWACGPVPRTGDAAGPARVKKKEPRSFCPPSARCEAWPLRKLRSDYEAGVSPQTAKTRSELVPRECVCQGKSKDSFVQKGVAAIRRSPEIRIKKRHGVGIGGRRRHRVSAGVTAGVLRRWDNC